jgi:hypothetical protein
MLVGVKSTSILYGKFPGKEYSVPGKVEDKYLDPVRWTPVVERLERDVTGGEEDVFFLVKKTIRIIMTVITISPEIVAPTIRPFLSISNTTNVEKHFRVYLVSEREITSFSISASLSEFDF